MLVQEPVQVSNKVDQCTALYVTLGVFLRMSVNQFFMALHWFFVQQYSGGYLALS